jgi:hypothetical protein
MIVLIFSFFGILLVKTICHFHYDINYLLFLLVDYSQFIYDSYYTSLLNIHKFLIYIFI